MIRRRLPTPAMLVACVALVVSLGGVSYAAGVLPSNSVGTAQLQKKAVSRAKLKRNAVTSTKVKNGSLMAADFKAGQLPAGPQGPRGVAGPKGPKGDPRPVGLTKTVQRYASLENVFAGNAATSTAWCKPGEVATGGGGFTYDDKVFVVATAPAPGAVSGKPFSGWGVRVSNTSATTQTFQAYVVCAS